MRLPPPAILPPRWGAMTGVTAPAVGERARPLDLHDLDGRRVRLEDRRGQAFVLVFLRHAG
jgi:peroxiredoxin